MVVSFFLNVIWKYFQNQTRLFVCSFTDSMTRKCRSKPCGQTEAAAHPSIQSHIELIKQGHLYSEFPKHNGLITQKPFQAEH